MGTFPVLKLILITMSLRRLLQYSSGESSRRGPRAPPNSSATSCRHSEPGVDTDPVSARTRGSIALSSSAYDLRPTSGEFLDYNDDGVDGSVEDNRTEPEPAGERT